MLSCGKNSGSILLNWVEMQVVSAESRKEKDGNNFVKYPLYEELKKKKKLYMAIPVQFISTIVVFLFL